MKQFSLEEYLANPSRKVVTRNGESVEYDGFSYFHKENIYDTLIEGIEHLIKEGYFNKEYLVWKRKAKFRK